MKTRLYLLLAIAAMLPGTAITAHAEPVTDECFTRTSDLSDIPTISSAEATCDAPTGRFDLSAEWVTPGGGLGPSFGGASFAADFYSEIDPTGLAAFDVHVTVHYERARAYAETTAVGDVIEGGQAASASIELLLPACSLCDSTAGQKYFGIAGTRQGEDSRTDQTVTHVLPIRRLSSDPYTSPVVLQMAISGAANGIYTPGRSEIEVSGTVLSISIQPPPPPSPTCEKNAYISVIGLSVEGDATADCNAAARTFATDLRVDNSVGFPQGESMIEWRDTRTFAGGTPFAVLEVPITVSRATFHAPGSTVARLWPDALATISVTYRLPSGHGVTSQFVVIDSTREEAWVGTRTMRYLIEAPHGQVLEGGAYEISVTVTANLNGQRFLGEPRPQWPDEPLELSLAGSIGTVTIAPLQPA